MPDYNTNAELFVGAGVTWINAGTVNDAGYGYMNPVGSDSATIVNQAGASFNFTTDDANLVQYNNGTDTFTNAGTLAKTAAPAPACSGPPSTAPDLFQVTTGVLDLTDGGSIGGTVSGSGTLELGGGTFGAGRRHRRHREYCHHRGHAEFFRLRHGQRVGSPSMAAASSPWVPGGAYHPVRRTDHRNIAG